jgi:DNA-binding transcriptional LysR family regulator
MTLQQLRGICAVVEHGYSVSRAAKALHTSQPAMSKMIRLVEDELKTEVFLRARGRIAGLTEIGTDVVSLARRILQDVNAISDVSAERFHQRSGVFKIGTTHLHARYALLDVIKDFRLIYPDVHLHLVLANPQQILDLVVRGDVQLAICTLPQQIPPDIVSLPAYTIERCVITPLHHPLLRQRKIRLADIARWPLVAYDNAFNSGWVIEAEFARRGLKPLVVMRATDADVIKAYVAAGLGISVFQKLALQQDDNLAVIDTPDLLPSSLTFINLRAGQYLRNFMYDFIRRVASQWDRCAVDAEVARQERRPHRRTSR